MVGHSEIEMNIEGTVIRKQAAAFFQPRSDERKIALTTIPPGVVIDRVGSNGGSFPLRIEGRININQIARTVGKTGHEWQIVTKM